MTEIVSSSCKVHCVCVLHHTGEFSKQSVGCVCVTHVKGKLAGEVVHATRVHETESVADSLGTEHTLACDWTDPSIS